MKFTEKTAYIAHRVYVVGGKTSASYGMTIPKDFALAMGLDEPKCSVLCSLITERENGGGGGGAATAGEEGSTRHSKRRRRVFLRVEKMIT